MLSAMATRPTPLAALFAAAVLISLAACAPEEESPAPAASATGSPCAKDTLQTTTAGKLTIGTDDPAYEPWFVDNKPDNGEGFEAAVAYAGRREARLRAGRRGRGPGSPFNNAIAPGPKAFDFDINQFSITDERKQAVDFSSPYYLVRQTVIALKGSKIAGAKSLADLKDAKLGAQVGTTSLPGDHRA